MIPISEIGEDAQRRVMTIVADFRELSGRTSDHRAVGRLPKHRTSRGGLLSVGTAIANILAVVESYNLGILQDTTLRAVSGGPQFVTEQWMTDQLRNAENSWDATRKAWKWFSVDLLACPEYGTLRSFVHVRNAELHGQGELTDRQNNQATRDALAAIGVGLEGRRLVLDLDHVMDCGSASGSFITFLEDDLRTPRGLVVP